MSDEWVQTTLGDVALINPDKTPKWDAQHRIRYVDIASVSRESGIDLSAVGDYPFGEAPGRARRLIRGGDVLISTVRPNLRAFALVPDSLDGEVASTGFAVLRGTDVALSGYLWAISQTDAFVEAMVSRCTGTNYPAIRAADIAGYEVTLPPPPIQRRIVDLLTHLDAHIANLRTEREALDRVRTASLEMAMQGELPVVAMSDEWVDRSLEELVDILDSMRKPVSADERQRRLGEVPYYGATGQAGWIDDFLFDEPLVLLGEDAVDFSNPLAQKAYVVRGPSWVNNHAHVLRAKESLVETDFLCHSLNHLDYAPYASFGTRSKLTQAKMRGIAVRVPPLPVQRRIVDLIADIDAEIAALDVEIASLKVARTSMLSSLLDASVAIPKPYDDLLERAS